MTVWLHGLILYERLTVNLTIGGHRQTVKLYELLRYHIVRQLFLKGLAKQIGRNMTIGTIEAHQELSLATGADNHGSIVDCGIFAYLILYLP